MADFVPSPTSSGEGHMYTYVQIQYIPVGVWADVFYFHKTIRLYALLSFNLALMYLLLCHREFIILSHRSCPHSLNYPL